MLYISETDKINRCYCYEISCKYLKRTNFCVYISSQISKYAQNMHLLCENAKINTRKKYAQKVLVDSAFLESINNNGFSIVTCLSFS